MTGHELAPICWALGIGRATAYRTRGPRARRSARADDRVVTAQIRSVTRSRASYVATPGTGACGRW